MKRRTRYVVAWLLIVAHATIAYLIGDNLHGAARIAVACVWLVTGMPAALALGHWVGRAER